MLDLFENYFTEERRIQSIINEEVNKAINEEQQKHKIKLKELRDKYIIDLATELKMSPEEIAKFTETSIDLVNKVLNGAN